MKKTWWKEGVVYQIYPRSFMYLPNQSDKFYKKPYKLTDVKNIFMKWYDGLHNVGWNSLFMNNHD